MKKIVIPKVKKNLKLQMLDPTGVVKTTYTLPYEIEGAESMIELRPLLVIGEHKYWIRDNGGFLDKLK